MLAHPATLIAPAAASPAILIMCCIPALLLVPARLMERDDRAPLNGFGDEPLLQLEFVAW
jgi:hypothetical protein